MKHAIFQKNINGQLVEISFKELFAEGRVLICSVNNPCNRITQVYMKYLQRLGKKLKTHNIDRIYVINSFDVWTIPVVEKFFPRLIPIVNKDRVFVQYLINTYNKQSRWDLAFLAEFWEYQVLLCQGEIEHFCHSPTENLELKILDSFKCMLPKLRWVRAEKKKMWLKKMSTLYAMSKEKPHLVLRQPEFYGDTDFTRHIRYQGLWPNNTLLEFLGDRSTAVSTDKNC